MLSINKSISLILINIVILTNGIYGSLKSNPLVPSNRQTKSYLTETLPAESYYDAALKGKVTSPISKKDAFLFSSLKRVGEKPSGINNGGIYEDPNGDIWFVKKAQNPIHEYLGSKLMNLLIGPLSPEVTPIIDSRQYTASKLLPSFIMKEDVLKDPNHKPIVGELELSLAMDIINQRDRNYGNLGYIEKEEKLEAAQVDFDFSVEFDSIDNFEIYQEIPPSTLLKRAIKDLDAIPDEMVLRVLGDAYNKLWEAGIPLNYTKYKDLGQIVILKKNELKEIAANTALFEALFDRAKYTPHLYTKKDNKDLEKAVRSLSKVPLLCWAITNKEKGLINFFIEKGADINAKNDTEWIGTPLHYSIFHDEIEIARLLLIHGADINATNTLSETPLLSAISWGKVDFINLLLDSNADINAKNDRGISPIHYAASRSTFEIFNLLLNNGANLNAKTNDNQTLLHFASQSSDIKIISFLIDKDFDVNAKDDAGLSPLHKAVIFENINAIHLLLEKGADIDARDKEGRSPIYQVIQHSMYRKAIHTVQLLLERGANIEPIEELLYLAIQSNRIDIFNMLLDHKLDLELKKKPNLQTTNSNHSNQSELTNTTES